MTTYDRSDTPALWRCLDSALLELPAATVARWASGGSVVECLTPNHNRIALGA